MRLMLFLSALLVPVGLAASDDPAAAYKFRVDIDGVDAGALLSVGEIICEVEVIEYQDGSDSIVRKRPGRVKYGNITLKRGYTSSTDLFDWWQQVADGLVEKKPMSLVLLDAAGKEAASFAFTECWPFKWKLSGFDGSAPSILTEEVTLVTESVAPGS